MKSLTLLILAAVFVLAAFFVGTEPVPGGGRSLEAFGLWTLAIACAAAAFLPVARFPAALYVLAFGSRLILTKPVWLQFVELRPGILRDGLRPLAILVLLVQLGWLLRRPGWLREIRAFLAGARSRGRVVLVLLLFLFCAAQATLCFDQGTGLFARAVFLPLQWAVVLVWVLADLRHLAILARDRKLGELADRVARSRWLAAGSLAVFVFVVSSSLALFVFERTPHIPDELDYLFQAEDFAAGALSRPAPPVPEAFAAYLLDIRDGRWFSTTNPGWPLVLALGVKVGLPWMVNPLLGALAVLLLHALARRFVDAPQALAMTALLAFSPWQLFISASLMTHSVALVALLLAAQGLVAAGRAANMPRAILPAWGGGLAAGWIFLVRPLDGLIAGGFLGVIVLIGALKKRGAALLVPVCFALGAIVTGSIYFLFNRAMTGDPFLPAMTAYTDRFWPGTTNRIGFGADVGNPPGGWGILDPFPGHGAIDFLLNTNQNLYNLNFELFGAGFGSLLPIAVLLLFAGKRDFGRLERGATFAIFAIVLGLGCYWFSGGPDFGARYWYLVLTPLLFLVWRGIEVFAAGSAGEGVFTPVEGSTLRAALLVTAALAILVFLPWRIEAKYRDYRGFHDDWRAVAEDPSLRGALVIVEASGESDWSSAFMQNRRGFPADRPIFARRLDSGTAAALHQAFPGRMIVHARGPSLTGGGIELEH